MLSTFGTASWANEQRPRIGLVLGGGGAKGAAHIGVLRALEEMRVPVDCIAGTSMGALVGATYASGVMPASIEEQVLAVDWAATVGNKGNRESSPIQRKLRDSSFTNSLDLGVVDGQLRDPGGFINTQQIDALLRRLVARARSTNDFDDLPIPFRAIATDMIAGDMVVIREGDLSVAMRASMAVPGAFSPVAIDGMVLSDGGQMRNLPIDIARDLCADVVISVSLDSPKPTEADLASSVAMAARSIDVMIDANTRAQRMTLKDRDVNIVVQMGDIGSASFERVPEAIPLGYSAAMDNAESLARYAVSHDAYAQWVVDVTTDMTLPIQVAEVTIDGLERVNPAYVAPAILNTTPGSDVTPEQISEDTSGINALGDFEAVTYSVSGEPDAKRVTFIPVEKSWGPNFVNFDLGFGASDGGDIKFVLRGSHRREWINALGGEWLNTVQIGSDLELGTSLYQPLEARQRLFVEPKLVYERDFENLYDDGDKLAEYSFSKGLAAIDLGYNLDTRAQFRIGVQQSWNESELETGSPLLLPETGTIHESNLTTQMKYDTRNSAGLASEGTLLALRYTDSGDWLDGDEDFAMGDALALFAVPFRGDVINIFAAGGKELSGDLPGYRLFRIGGVRSFPGLETHEFRGDSYWLAGSNYNWRLADIQTLFDQAFYAGLRLTAGEVNGRIDNEDDELLLGIALSLNGRTPIGPFILSLGAVNNDSWALQMSVGRPMREGSIVDEIR